MAGSQGSIACFWLGGRIGFSLIDISSSSDFLSALALRTRMPRGSTHHLLVRRRQDRGSGSGSNRSASLMRYEWALTLLWSGHTRSHQNQDAPRMATRGRHRGERKVMISFMVVFSRPALMTALDAPYNSFNPTGTQRSRTCRRWSNTIDHPLLVDSSSSIRISRPRCRILPQRPIAREPPPLHRYPMLDPHPRRLTSVKTRRSCVRLGERKPDCGRSEPNQNCIHPIWSKSTQCLRTASNFSQNLVPIPCRVRRHSRSLSHSLVCPIAH